MATRKLSKEILSRIENTLANDVIAIKKYGEDPRYNVIELLVEYYKKYLNMDITDYLKYDKYNLFSIDYKKVIKDYGVLNPQIFGTILLENYWYIAGITVKQLKVENIDDYNKALQIITDFGYENDWPQWKKRKLDSLIKGVQHITNFENPVQSEMYEKYLNSSPEYIRNILQTHK